ncbi:3-hydroxyacyl-CoA dehydrogenase/enoyl-CoA hydratase family protein [Alcaligenaceae bacterium]|nr:3-hydroxyacyl-CoA dehydrogenase/enoyl-CoA hydratase family protein [Alcaligenaceae bacterium]
MGQNKGGRRPRLNRVAVCGAGVMGAQIAAHCVNAGIPVVLFDLASEGDRNAIVRKALAGLRTLKPAPLGLPEMAGLITPANYEDDLHRLADCDLVIEAIAERLDWKRELYARIAPALRHDAVLATNTSGLSISVLAEGLPESLRERFCGVHFFNPPRYMPLVELIPTRHTDAALLDMLESFLVSGLGKSVVRARDTPNFIANRIGVFGIMAAIEHARRLGLSVDVVDELTGTRLGRAKSGTFRTADVVGLDTLAHVMRTMEDQLPGDPFHAYFSVPPVLRALVEQGALGQKSGAGFYRKEGRRILRLDPDTGQYVPAEGAIDPEVAALLAEKDASVRLKGLRASSHPQARFVWSLLRDTLHYSAVHLHDIAGTARELDLAMQWGFGHRQGPFELWQAAGWRDVAGWIREDIAQGATLSDAPLPDWVDAPGVIGAGGVYTAEGGAWNPASSDFEAPRDLPVYRRHVGPGPYAAARPRRTVHEDSAIRCWVLEDAPDVLIASFRTRMHTLSPDVVRGIMRAADLAESGYRGLVVGHVDDPFSAGADLKALMPIFEQGGPGAVAPIQREMQDMVLRLRYAQVPVVAALAGMALGGGCELAVHCDRRVAHFETYIGLVEVGIGLIPGAGGLAYCARRAAELRAGAPEAPLLAFLKGFALAVAGARVSGSAAEARQLGYLQPQDKVVMHRNEVLHVAVSEARALAEAGYRPPMAGRFPAAGRDGAATLRAQIVNLQVGGYISDYDAEVAGVVAEVICGGDIDPGSEIDEAWMMACERRGFIGLLGREKTQARIRGFLETGKPTRN